MRSRCSTDDAPPETYPLSLHDALPIFLWFGAMHVLAGKLTVGEILVFTSYLASLYAPINSLMQTYGLVQGARVGAERVFEIRSEEHTSELQSRRDLVCRLLPEKKNVKL